MSLRSVSIGERLAHAGSCSSAWSSKPWQWIRCRTANSAPSLATETVYVGCAGAKCIPPKRNTCGPAILRGCGRPGRHSRALAANPALQPATGPIHRPRGRQRAAVCRLRPRAQSLLCHALHRTPPGTPAGVREALGRRVHSDRQWVEFIGSWNARADSVFTQAVCHVPGLTHCAVPPGARGIRGGRRTRMTCRTVPRRGSRTWMTEQWKTDPGTHRPCGH